MDYAKLADILFPDIEKSPEDYEKMFPERDIPDGAMVTRLGPSPTGFIHLGNLYGAFVDERLAHLSGGIFYLRIEDTDDKRYVEGAVKTIIDSLDFFDIHFDEGATLAGDKGAYGPYSQSERGEIYRCFVKDMVKKGFAYPCFMTEDEIAEIRKEQEAGKLTPGKHRCRQAVCNKAQIHRGSRHASGEDTPDTDKRRYPREAFHARKRPGHSHPEDYGHPHLPLRPRHRRPLHEDDSRGPR